MPYLAEYLLKLSFSLMVVYLFYVLVLRRLTFYVWNRWYLLGYSVLSFLIPLINVSPVLDMNAWDNNMVIQFVPAFGAAALTDAGGKESFWQSYGYWSAIFVFILPGISVMTIRFLVRCFSLRRIRRSARLLVNDTVKVYHVDRAIIPFSFGNAIFVNKKLHTEDELQQIISHELVHVKQKHTADLLWSELLCIVNWYNPFAWLIRKAIRQNLEFIADQVVLKNGVEKKEYQYLLLRVTGGSFTITNHFNFASLKKRIIMMNRSRSTRIQLGRFLFLLPVMAILLLAFRSRTTQNSTLLPGIPAAVQTAQPVNALKLNTDTVPVREKPESSHHLSKLKIPENPLVIIDGKEQPDGKEAFRNLHDGEIESINIIKGETAVKLYGNKAKDGVVRITTKNAPDVVEVRAAGSEKDPAPPLYIIDGKEFSAEEFKALQIDPQQIRSINVLKGEHATGTYGSKGKNGVIVITLK